MCGDQHLLFEFDAFAATNAADVALDSDGHVRFEHAVLAALVEQVGVEDDRILGDHLVAVHWTQVAALDELIGDPPPLLGEAANLLTTMLCNLTQNPV